MRITGDCPVIDPALIDATVELVWDPPWDPRTMATEEARMDLGIY